MQALEQGTDLMNVLEASAMLRLKVSTIRSWLLKRRMTFVKLGGRVFLRRCDCLALIEAGLTPARPLAHRKTGAA